MTALIRLAEEQDARQIQAIYGPIVEQTAISFETQAPSVDEMRSRISDTLTHFPWLVCVQDENFLGYAYAGKHRTRSAYQWSVDVSVYVQPQARRRGVGKALYSSLFKLLTLQGFYNAFAGIALPNPASVGLHESFGFQPVGVYKGVGYKLGAWRDVGWWALSLRPKTTHPPATRSIRELQASAEGQAALEIGLSFLRW